MWAVKYNHAPEALSSTVVGDRASDWSDGGVMSPVTGPTAPAAAMGHAEIPAAAIAMRTLRPLSPARPLPTFCQIRHSQQGFLRRGFGTTTPGCDQSLVRSSCIRQSGARRHRD